MALVVGLALVLVPAGSWRARATPPRPPLDLELRLIAAPGPGRPARIVAVVTPRLAGESVRLRLVPPPGARLAAGDTLAIRPAPAAGDSVVIAVAVALPEGRPGRLVARAELVMPGGAIFACGAGVALGRGGQIVPSPRPRALPGDAGGGLLLYDGAPAAGPAPAGGGRP